MKEAPKVVAVSFLTTYFPDCDGAILAGSIVRGEGTSTSDLDIVIFQENLKSAYRETFYISGWPIEVFVHNFTSYKAFFESDRERARPSLPRMVVEGDILISHPKLDEIKEEAGVLLGEGPEPWSEQTIQFKRYMLTDVLDDFIGSKKEEEELWTANALAEIIHEFYLRTNRQWIGHSKWVYRSLKSFNPGFADRFYQAFQLYYKRGDKKLVIQLAEEVMAPYGGRLLEGFSMGKKK